jgi:hypothetical protein
MMIQVFLSALLAGVALMVGLQRTTSRLLRATVLVVIALGAYFVWVPDQTTRLAALLGVGRGADLVMYLWVVITLALIVLLYLKIVRLSRKLTQLTRASALADPKQPANGDAP